MRTDVLSRRAAAWTAAAPFDVPCEEQFVGLRRSGDALICVLAVAPSPPSPVVVGAAPQDGPPLLAAVAAAMSMRDTAPAAIDIVSHTMGGWGDTPAARAYRGLLGGLRIAAHRSVHLVLRIRPADLPRAVQARGGGGRGTLRTALWCVRRVRAALADSGIVAHPLTASEVTELTSLLAEGAAVTDAVDAEIGLRHNGVQLTAYRLSDHRPETLARLLTAPVADEAVSTTVTLGYTATPAGPRLQVTVRDNGGPTVDRRGDHSLRLVTTGCRAAIAAGLPIGLPPGLRSGLPRDDGWQGYDAATTAHLARTLTIPLAGDGQIVGADRAGSPVALRLAGRDVPRCDVIGDHTLARQSVDRLAALGLTVNVISDHPRRWARLADSVGNGLVAIGDCAYRTQVVVDDTAAGGVTAAPGTTLMRRSTTDSVVALPPHVGPVLRQSASDATVYAEGSGRRVPIRLVSTSAERTLTETD